MIDMTPERWRFTETYLRDVFGRPDERLSTLMSRAVAAGLPDIAVSAEVGRLLSLLASTTNGGRGPQRALELGTLAGYSASWIARSLGPGGRLITLEPAPLHADFAEREFAAAGLSDRIELRRSPALAELPRLAAEFGPASFDFIFVDAIKTEYPDYFAACEPLLRAGGIMVFDNVLGSASWWIDMDTPESRAVDRLNRLVAADAGLTAVGLPFRQGLLVARKPSTA